MKKTIALFLFISFILTTVYAQKPLDIKGTYKNKPFSAKGSYKPDGTAVLTSFSYAPYDKLESDVRELKEQKKKLEDEKAKLERKNKELIEKGGNSAELNNSIDALNDSLSATSLLLKSRSLELERVSSEVAALRSQMQDTVNAHRQLVGRYSTELRNKDQKIAELEMVVQGKGLNANAVGVSFFFGPSNVKNSHVEQDYWKRSFSPAIQFMVDYSIYFSENSPFSLKVGLGYASYGAGVYAESILDTICGLTDGDGDVYDSRYAYSSVREKVTLNYLEIPVVFHIGNSFLTGGVQAWIEAGLKLGVNIGGSFEGGGKYSCEGYYPQWNVSMRNVDVMGFVSNADIYDGQESVDVSKVLLWGVLSAGMSIPLSEKLALQIGAQCGYTLSPLKKSDSDYSRFSLGESNLLSTTTRLFNIGGKVGLTFNL